MPNRPVFALLVLTILSFPVALLAGGVVQTEKFNYPLTNGGKFTIDDANGTIAISCWDKNEVEITATKHTETQADLDAIRSDVKPSNGSINADCTDLGGDGHLRTTNGSITLALPRSADALIDAATTVGRINSNLSTNKINKGVVGETLEARLGAGSHHLEAKTTNGSIRLEAR